MAACTAPLLALRDNWLKLRPALGMVIAILGEDRTVLREYAYAQELPFLLSNGGDGALAKAYGVGTQNSSRSQLFLISSAMKITARITDPGPQIAEDLQAALPPPAVP
jgi:peroxiredoxin